LKKTLDFKGLVPSLVPEAVPELGMIVAAKRRHWKEKDGRFWARMAVPKELQPIIGKSEIIIALGGDLRAAQRAHAAAVAQLQAQIEQAPGGVAPKRSLPAPVRIPRPLTQEDCERAAWAHFSATLKADEEKRLELPTQAEIAAEHEKAMQRGEAGEADPALGLAAMINVYTDFHLAAGARHFYAKHRTKRLSALRTAIANSDTRLVDAKVQTYVDLHGIDIVLGSIDWRTLAHAFLRAEADAIERTLERDEGRYSSAPKDPILKPPPPLSEEVDPVPIKTLFHDYIVARQALGKHRDGAKQWENAIDNLIDFLGNNDARKVTKRNLLNWRDALLKGGKSPKTVSNVYLASTRAMLKWAYENALLATNEGETVRQEVPRKIMSREKGYTATEATKLLKASIGYKPTTSHNPSNRESAHLIAAKRWIPLLCAFTGARVTEMAQLRKEDVRQDGDRWIIRITPEAGSVKTGEYRDVPLHGQIVALGFIDFLKAAKSEPMFHGATEPDKFLANARATSGRLSEWLREAGLVPDGVQPSHGWRHRFKTVARELGLSDRTIDAIQGHAGRTAGDNYGDVTLTAKARAIDAFPDYDLTP
jgi:integrase